MPRHHSSAPVVVAGFPSSGKSSVLKALLVHARTHGYQTRTARLECYEASPGAGAPVRDDERRWTTGDLCPDHALVDLLPEMRAWAKAAEALLTIETAGLCARCSPFPVESVALCVMDATGGLEQPRKVGPMLETADIAVVTRRDRVSATELALFERAIRGAHGGDLAVISVNGLTGEGGMELWSLVEPLLEGRSGEVDGDPLRSPLPEFYCSYCLGRTRVGIYEV